MTDQEIPVFIARIDERTATLVKSIEELKAEIKASELRFQERYVTQEEFRPLKTLVYGVVWIILAAVIAAVLGVVLLRPSITIPTNPTPKTYEQNPSSPSHIIWRDRPSDDRPVYSF